MIKNALLYCGRRRSRFVTDLAKLVSVASCAFPGFPRGEMMRSAQAVADFLKRTGLNNVNLLRLPGAAPYVYGDWLHAPGKPTALLYAHHDIQPAGKTALWKSPPFKATRRGGRLYGRGAADDKGGICLHGAAIESYLKTSGKLPINIKVLIEGEEEIGSEHLGAFLKRHARKVQADVIVIADTGNFAAGTPSITTSLRGLISTEVTVRTAKHSLHSGMWGGPIPDPVQALAKMIASLSDGRGRIAIPGVYKDVRPLSRVERGSLKSLRYSDRLYRREADVISGVGLVGGPGSALLKLWREPALSVNAIEASSRKELSNIINESAWCHIGIRIVPDMDPGKTLRALKAHLKKNAPWNVRVGFSAEATARWWMTDPSAPCFQAAQKALGKGYGRKAVFVGSGGSIPFIGPFSQALGGAPALLIGIDDPLSNPHSENESLLLADFHKAIRGSIHLYDELGKGNVS